MVDFVQVPGDGVIGWRLEGEVDYPDVEMALGKCCQTTQQNNVFLWQGATKVSVVQNATKGLYVEIESTNTILTEAFRVALASELS